MILIWTSRWYVFYSEWLYSYLLKECEGNQRWKTVYIHNYFGNKLQCNIWTPQILFQVGPHYSFRTDFPLSLSAFPRFVYLGQSAILWDYSEFIIKSLGVCAPPHASSAQEGFIHMIHKCVNKRIKSMRHLKEKKLMGTGPVTKTTFHPLWCSSFMVVMSSMLKKQMAKIGSFYRTLTILHPPSPFQGQLSSAIFQRSGCK